MSRSRLTDLGIQKLSTRSSAREEYWDAALPGFGVRVSPAGTKTFILLYRAGGRSRRASLGRYPSVSLAEARKLAHQALHAVAAGRDPAAHKPPQADRAFHFNRALDTYLALHCREHNRPSTVRETSGLLRGKFLPHWGSRNVQQITKADVIAVIDRLLASGTPSAANHAFAALRTFFNWCVQRGLLQINPMTGLKRPAKTPSRERVLRAEELAAVWHAAGECAYPYGTIVRLLILTGQRRGEVANMAWHQIDLEAQTWLIPASLTKSNRAHLLPLSPGVMAVLGTIPRLSANLLFPTAHRNDQPVGSFARFKTELNGRVGFSDWTLHDLRRTFSTNMAKWQIAPPHIIERILNHTNPASLGGHVAQIYNRHAYFAEMKDCMCRYEQYLLQHFERNAKSVPSGSAWG